MPSCEDDLTTTDLDLLQQQHYSSSSSSTATHTSSSLYKYISFNHSTALNIDTSLTNSNAGGHLNHLIRPLEEKDLVIDIPQPIQHSDDSSTPQQSQTRGGSLTSLSPPGDLLLHIKFLEPVRIKSILIGTGGGRLETSPGRCKVWVNRVGGGEIGWREAGGEEGDGGSDSEDEDGANSNGGGGSGAGASVVGERRSLRPGEVKSDMEWMLVQGGNPGLGGGSGGNGAVEYPTRVSRFGNVEMITLYFSSPPSPSQTSRLYYLNFLGESRRPPQRQAFGIKIGAEEKGDSKVDGARGWEKGGSGVGVR